MLLGVKHIEKIPNTIDFGKYKTQKEKTMKLSDFTLKTHNIAAPGEPRKEEIWESGSRCNIWAKGTKGGTDYQIKAHTAEPVWEFVDQKIDAKVKEIAACPAGDDVMLDRLNKELASLKKNRDTAIRNDENANKYVESKQRLIKAIHAIGDSHLVCPVDFWTEALDFKGNGTFALEAVPWIKHNVSFEVSAPIYFGSIDPELQYDAVASLCEHLAKLHAAGIMHSDLKLSNAVFNNGSGGMSAYLIDFDSAVVLDDLYSREYPVEVWYYIIGGTHFAPELYDLFCVCRENCDPDGYRDFDLNSITTKADIFSLGITIYELFFGETSSANILPLVGPDGDLADTTEYGPAVAYGYKPDLPDSVNDLLYGVLNWMLVKNPDERPTAEQVANVFRTRSLDTVPMQYVRNPLWEEHREKYKLTLPDDVSISHAFKPDYRVKRNGVTVNRSIENLVKEGLAVMLGADGAPTTPTDPSKSELAQKIWDKDGSGDLPACVRRGTEEGIYLITVGGMTKRIEFSELKSKGYICDEAEKAKPWPCDAGLKFSETREIHRDMKRGEGYYLVGSREIAAIPYNKSELIKRGYASTTVFFKLKQEEKDAGYEPISDAIPANVAAIKRSTVMKSKFYLTYVDGSSECLSIDEMVSRGYVRKK